MASVTETTSHAACALTARPRAPRANGPLSTLLRAARLTVVYGSEATNLR
jgi:hypothetical protein